MVVTCFLENVLFLINFVKKHINLQVFVFLLICKTICHIGFFNQAVRSILVVVVSD